MELQHVNVKIPVAGELTIDLEQVIKVFHRWVSGQSLDELLIDVADYRHVPAGPGVVLVGHEADYALDNAGGQWGLLYNRKAALDGTNSDRLRQAFQSAAKACTLLEAEFGDELNFSRQNFDLLINDRALAPNSVETLTSCQSDLEAFLTSLLQNSDFALRQDADARRRFKVSVALETPLEWS